MSALEVKIAVYGALLNGEPDQMRAIDVTEQLQAALNSNSNSGKVTISNISMGGDPAPRYTKAFGAVVALDGVPQFFACLENQTVDFYHSQQVDDENEQARKAAN